VFTKSLHHVSEISRHHTKHLELRIQTNFLKEKYVAGRYLINACRVAVVVTTERRCGRVILVALRCLRGTH
jgi:hypothetical protein